MTSRNSPGVAETPIYLCAPVNALVEGIYEENIHLSEVLEHGDFGLGTFNDLDGEMVILDGRVYQISAEGGVTTVADSAMTPFATVTFYSPTSHAEFNESLSYDLFLKRLNQHLPSPNLFYAIRIDGTFSHVRARSVPRQANYHPLAEVVHEQVVFEFNDIEGTLAGFFTPAFMSSLSVPGLHLHFLSSDLKQGGHLLECELVKAHVGIQPIRKLELSLPMTTDYLNWDFHRAVARDLNTIER